MCQKYGGFCRKYKDEQDNPHPSLKNHFFFSLGVHITWLHGLSQCWYLPSPGMCFSPPWWVFLLQRVYPPSLLPSLPPFPMMKVVLTVTALQVKSLTSQFSVAPCLLTRLSPPGPCYHVALFHFPGGCHSFP